MQKSVLFFLVCSLLLAATVGSQVLKWAAAENPELAPVETQVTNKVNGTNIYDYDLELEKISLNHSLSGYSFRSSGSTGGNATANWIQKQFENFDLETSAEEFEFVTWNIVTKPAFKVDLDGNPNTTDDRVVMDSFQPEHYSWSTPEEGIFAQLTALPMPNVVSREGIAGARYDPSAWLAINTTGKILFVGREIRMNSYLTLAFKNKLNEQPPAALIFTWWYSWMSWVPPYFGSVGGLPISQYGAYQWNQHLPVGFVSYEDGQWIRSALANNTSISAQVIVNASITQSNHYNIVGKLRGSTNPEKMIIISAHYDSVVTPAFCDNGAGVAGLLELARVFTDANETGEYRPAFTLVFVAFAGEELGLVGSVNYMKKHGPEMRDVVAVINLDCIGNNILEITETTTDDNGLNLQNIVAKAGQDLRVIVEYTEPGGSDQETFRVPSTTNEEYRLIWGLDPGIAAETRVKSSIMISSRPLFYSDEWTNVGVPGWVHTPYDNSTSSQTLDWVGVDRLQAHVQVTALSIMCVLSATQNPFLMQVYIGAAVMSVLTAVLIYSMRKRANIFMKKVCHEILTNFGLKELVFTIFLTGVYMFMSFTLFTRVGRDEVVIFGFPTIVTYHYYGKPFEMIALMTSSVGSGGTDVYAWMVHPISLMRAEGFQALASPPNVGTTNVLLPGLLLNALIFGMLAFLTVYAVAKLNYLRQYYRSSDVKHKLEQEE